MKRIFQNKTKILKRSIILMVLSVEVNLIVFLCVRRVPDGFPYRSNSTVRSIILRGEGTCCNDDGQSLTLRRLRMFSPRHQMTEIQRYANIVLCVVTALLLLKTRAGSRYEESRSIFAASTELLFCSASC